MGKRAFLLAGVAAVLLAGVALAAPAYEIQRYVLGSGGGRVSAGSYTLEGTVGQSVTGIASRLDYVLQSGFWFGTVRYGAYLPLVLKAGP